MDDRDTSHDALVFAMPFLQAVGMSHVDRATAIALMCWNIGLLNESLRGAALDQLVASLSFASSWFPASKDGIGEIGHWVDRLIIRKRTHFGHRQRVIVSHAVSVRDGMVTLTTGTIALDGKTWRLN